MTIDGIANKIRDQSIPLFPYTLNDILNPISSQVKSLGSFIKRSLELRTGGT